MNTTTIKEVEGAMPVKKDFEYIRGLDPQGNPIRLNKADVASVLEGLMSEADVNKKGLLSKELYKTTAHFVIAYNIVYKLTNIGLDKWWIRFPVSICSHIDDTPFTDTIAVFKTDTNLNVKIVRVASDANLIREKVKYYIKDKELYISFLASNNQPNNAFITSPYFHEIAGTPQEIIDDSFKEVIVKTVV